MTHYSPIEATPLVGERLEIDPVLGSDLLAEAIDTGGAHLAVHGHAHRVVVRRGRLCAGCRCANVAQPLLGPPYTVLHLGTEASPTASRDSVVPGCDRARGRLLEPPPWPSTAFPSRRATS